MISESDNYGGIDSFRGLYWETCAIGKDIKRTLYEDNRINNNHTCYYWKLLNSKNVEVSSTNDAEVTVPESFIYKVR